MTDLPSERLCWDCFFLAQVELSGRMSTCRTRHVGGVLVRDRRVVAQGFNGNLPGHPHCDAGGCERCEARARGEGASGHDLHVCNCCHAEQNIISYCARYGVSSAGTALYLPCNPCLDCFKLVVSAGIQEIIFAERYPSTYVITRTLAASSDVEMRMVECKCVV